MLLEVQAFWCDLLELEVKLSAASCHRPKDSARYHSDTVSSRLEQLT